jgi:hypothetical protein
VAVWAGALGGASVLAIRPGLITGLLANRQIILPLGIDPRLPLALAATLLGTVLGRGIALIIARFVPWLSARQSAAAELPADPPQPRRRQFASAPAFAPLIPSDPEPAAANAAVQIFDVVAFGPEAMLAAPEPLPATPTAPVAPRQVFGMLPGEEVADLAPQLPDQLPRQMASSAISPPAAAPAVEPIVIFPGHVTTPGASAPPAPEPAERHAPIHPLETEQALRTALANLQHLTGAA